MPIHYPITHDPFITVLLSSGIRIDADSVIIQSTYHSLLEGLPDDQSNSDHLARLPSHYQKLWSGVTIPVLVIPSEVERFERPRGWPWRVAMLPRVEIAAFFNSHTVKIPTYTGSLIIVWHQHEPAPLMAPEVRAKVELIDWPALAEEYPVC